MKLSAEQEAALLEARDNEKDFNMDLRNASDEGAIPKFIIDSIALV